MLGSEVVSKLCAGCITDPAESGAKKEGEARGGGSGEENK